MSFDPGGGLGLGGEPSDGAQTPLLRPYTITGGRTRPSVEFAMEALVTTMVPAHHELFGVGPEQAAIVTLCQSSRSVAEIAALLGVPLGVARVLVGDVVELGLVEVHQPGSQEGVGLDLLERVLSGLRKL
ncbi:MAG: DUF742 domain-containing protein [Carbonactinosporaceae bacterium]